MRSLLPLGACALVLCACNADVFTSGDGGSDGAPTGGDANATTDAAGGGDAVSGGDAIASNTVSIQCATGTCTSEQACCASALWDTAACLSTSNVGNQVTCPRYLSCDNTGDCPQGDVCCADYGTNGGPNLILTAKCAASCTGQNQVQLCTDGAECGGGTCADWNGGPSWVKTCQ